MIKKIALLIFISLVIQSCATKKDILLYQDAVEGGQEKINFLPSKVQINDILYIRVAAIIPESVEPFNINLNTSNSTNVSTLKLQGYLVSELGTIVFPILGTVKVQGLTTLETQNLIAKMLNDNGLVKEPTVSVRIVNSKVTVLGEVNVPGTYSFDEQSISLSQAIGYAGGLTINGVRKDVLLIREVDGVRTYTHLDLTKSDWFKGPYFYVKQNDVIIINPNGPKIMTSGYLGNVGSVLGVVSIGLTLLLLLK
jgi:polysaccharide export outer membrane protein